MTKKNETSERMKELAKQSGISETEKSNFSDKLHPPHGKRGHFIKLSITLEPSQYKSIVMESAKRKVDQQKNNRLSDVVRDAIDMYFSSGA